MFQIFCSRFPMIINYHIQKKKNLCSEEGGVCQLSIPKTCSECADFDAVCLAMNLNTCIDLG